MTGFFASCNNVVVTGSADCSDFVVIQFCAGDEVSRAGTMACFAERCCRHMFRRLSLCAAIVVTGYTGTAYLCMDSGKTGLNCPGNSGLGVAFVALLFSRYVARWFSSRNNVVMAAGTKTKDLTVVYS